MRSLRIGTGEVLAPSEKPADELPVSSSVSSSESRAASSPHGVWGANVMVAGGLHLNGNGSF
ncbi:hypothetical protein [Synechococcus sp. MIT S9451]|uniref:hypothetical protein n=1 Tax=Synechococcus sp. MIT S9451 TaxID=3082543 RepID=UPI0039B5D42C